jgi:superoxide dismutase, Cu-Zn family
MSFNNFVFVAPILLCIACGGSQPAPSEPPAPAPEPALSPAQTAEVPPAAEAEPPAPAASPAGPLEVKIEARSGAKLSGKAKLEPVEGGVKLTIDIQNAPPGPHGAHIHEKADCSAPDGKSAGDHFNPGGHKHALPGTEPRHLGDLGNIEVDKKGFGRLEIVIQGANLDAGDKHSFVDRAIIIHEKEDTGAQPTGDAGGRIGCAEIKR